MADYIQKFKPGAAVSFTASGPVVGGGLVEVTGDRTVAVAGAKSVAVVGIAAEDAVAGERVTVFTRGSVEDVVASGAVAAGKQVEAAADGRVAEVEAGGIALALIGAAAGDKLTVMWI